jgi:hypothetical protein
LFSAEDIAALVGAAASPDDGAIHLTATYTGLLGT